LSKREIDVLRLIAAGYENAAIAESLSISPNTVKRHVAAILLKLRSDNRTQAAVVAVRERLI
jgi:DNA-binding NarL/FixJ family response regulator